MTQVRIIFTLQDNGIKHLFIKAIMQSAPLSGPSNPVMRIDMAKLIKIYRRLDFVYPYSQSIGFLLDRAGMSKHASVIHKKFPPEHSFFVDHDAKTSWIYDEKWKLYYPAGLVDEN